MSIELGTLDQLCEWLEAYPEALVFTGDLIIRQAILAQTGHRPEQIKVASEFPSAQAAIAWFHDVLRGQPTHSHQPPTVFIARHSLVSRQAVRGQQERHA